MTITSRSENTAESDFELWQLVCQGSASAFEVLVRRYQSLVCSVAYSACGNLASSEDVAQETFWTAWRQRASLRAARPLEGVAVRHRAKSRQERPAQGVATGRIRPNAGR